MDAHILFIIFLLFNADHCKVTARGSLKSARKKKLLIKDQAFIEQCLENALLC
jgi:hypothetical protein